MHQAQATDLIRRLFHEVTITLFESMDCTVEESNAPASTGDYIPAAFIDAGSHDIELLITLRLPLPALTMTYPTTSMALSVDESELEDWIAELSNRLLGLLKGELFARDCCLTTGLPCHELSPEHVSHLAQLEYYPLYLRLDNEPVEIGLTLDVLQENITLNEQAKTNPHSTQAGDIDFFF